MKLNRIILASASPRRKELLQQIDIQFECMVSNEEEIITSENPAEVVEELSKQKAMNVAKQCNEEFDLIIGADTVVAYNNKILGKPADRQDAIETIRMLQSDKHQVCTGVTLVLKDKIITFHEKTDVYVYPISDDLIEKYVDTKECMDKAGSYAIQGRFARYIRRIEGDYNNVVGLPVSAIVRRLTEEGLDI